MEREELLEVIANLGAELIALAPDCESPECQSWKIRAELAFSRVFGEQHPLTREMSAVAFFPAELTRRHWTPEVRALAFDKGGREP